jgi:hypothetical protein
MMADPQKQMQALSNEYEALQTGMSVFLGRGKLHA